jgi:hypothetical protein
MYGKGGFLRVRTLRMRVTRLPLVLEGWFREGGFKSRVAGLPFYVTAGGHGYYGTAGWGGGSALPRELRGIPNIILFS